MDQIFYGNRADHRLKFLVSEGQDRIAIEVVDHIVGQARIFASSSWFKPSPVNFVSSKGRWEMGIPTAHQVENPGTGFQQTPIERLDGGVGLVIDVVDQPGFFVKYGVIPAISPGKRIVGEEISRSLASAGLACLGRRR